MTAILNLSLSYDPRQSYCLGANATCVTVESRFGVVAFFAYNAVISFRDLFSIHGLREKRGGRFSGVPAMTFVMVMIRAQSGVICCWGN